MIEPADLLAPVPGAAPQGADLRNPAPHPLWSDLRSLWRNVRQKDPQEGGETGADWAGVERQAAVILTAHSKDLEVAAWLAEALIHTEDFAGLAAGGAVIAGLVDRFWDGLYPAPAADEPDITPEDARLEPLGFLADVNGRLLPAVRRVVLFSLDDGTGFTFSDCQESKAWTAMRPEQRAQRLSRLPPAERMVRERSAGAQIWDTVRQTVLSGRTEAMTALCRDIAAAQQAWRNVTATLADRAGDGRFPSQPLLDLLGDVLRTVTELAPAMPPPEEPPPAETMADVPPETPAAAAMAARRLDSRDEALRQLAEITAFFRRTEPHSPLAYTLEEAMRRARLSWPEWLAEVVPDRQQRDSILLRLGLRPEGT